jgi:cobyrinic acid a,c-diamide synthase
MCLPHTCLKHVNAEIQPLNTGYIPWQVGGGLLPAGLKLRGHFFHFSEVVQEKASSPGVADPVAGGDASGVEDGWVSAFSARLLPWEGEPMAEGYSRGRVLASQVHLHWGSEPRMASALVEAASQVRSHRRRNDVQDISSYLNKRIC